MLNRIMALTERDPSAKLLLLSNLATIAMAIAFGWSLLTVLWGYWLQSVIIGLFTVVKILRTPGGLFAKDILEAARKGNLKGPSKAGQIMGKTGLAGFFTIHYGMFHLVYAFFLFAFTTDIWPATGLIAGPDVIGIMGIGAIFFANHLYSFLKHYVFNKNTPRESMSQIFMSPYARIIPMHFTILFGGGLILSTPYAEKIVLVFFMLLKTCVDIAGHNILHAKEKQKAAEII